MHGLDPGLTQLEFDIEGEIRRIDSDEHVRFFLDQGLNQQLAPCQQLTQTAQHFHQPHDRQALHGEVGGEAFSLHQRAAHTDELNRWMLGLERPHQPRAQDIAGSFPATNAIRRLAMISG